MTALSNTPLHAVLPLAAYVLEDLKKAANFADQTVLHANLKDCSDCTSVLAGLVKDLKLPRQSSESLGTLYGCLKEMKAFNGGEQPGFVVVLENLPENKAFGAIERNAVLDAFRDAGDFFFDQRTAFRVFYSVSKPQ
jgi:Barstar (barnase inhibitor)